MDHTKTDVRVEQTEALDLLKEKNRIANLKFYIKTILSKNKDLKCAITKMLL